MQIQPVCVFELLSLLLHLQVCLLIGDAPVGRTVWEGCLAHWTGLSNLKHTSG